MADTTTQARIFWPTVMVVGDTVSRRPGYLRALEGEGYVIETAADAIGARDAMGAVMPHVVILSRSVPMADHRHIHDAAAAVGAEVLLTPDDAHPELVRVEVEIVMKRALNRRREKK